MTEPEESENEYNETATIRGSQIWLVESKKNTSKDLVGLVVVQARGNSYYFVQDEISKEYCAVHCTFFIEDAEKKLCRSHVRRMHVNNSVIVQELIDSERVEDEERVSNLATRLMKILEEKHKVGVETA